MYRPIIIATVALTSVCHFCARELALKAVVWSYTYVCRYIIPIIPIMYTKFVVYVQLS